MVWKPSPPPLAALFDALCDALAPGHGGLARRKMFGYPSVFVGGHLCFGLHEHRLVPRLPRARRAELLAAGAVSVFAPTPGGRWRISPRSRTLWSGTATRSWRWPPRRSPTPPPCLRNRGGRANGGPDRGRVGFPERPRVRHWTSVSHGLTTATPVFRNSAVSRVTTVSPRPSAILAIIASGM